MYYLINEETLQGMCGAVKEATGNNNVIPVKNIKDKISEINSNNSENSGNNNLEFIEITVELRYDVNKHSTEFQYGYEEFLVDFDYIDENLNLCHFYEGWEWSGGEPDEFIKIKTIKIPKDCDIFMFISAPLGAYDITASMNNEDFYFPLFKYELVENAGGHIVTLFHKYFLVNGTHIIIE